MSCFFVAFGGWFVAVAAAVNGIVYGGVSGCWCCSFVFAAMAFVCPSLFLVLQLLLVGLLFMLLILDMLLLCWCDWWC